MHYGPLDRLKYWSFSVAKTFWRIHVSYFGATGTPVLDFW